ncbi:N-acetylglutamate synthase [Clostridium pasteurianum DSM 525 = ATCC 6013]|uniref:GCN5-related N-acetyltransferase n=1 Tax=Clostridium pasteurianum DSM 525 = ATCC 6013 TaxID=1262449 RepID=A0A0H3J5T0_CLOPA|nr:GNAT family N-acetyltransferase [Clostridium pasteurianum]AJA47258.1 N-acetylglutamate synthase [Clostridium pasteurianum DSM 525 = ATCC 6013]AJA51246.1 N-acetylglutamate synthase [Clostridium pasteurianum DSM 525 = ATCC 6013]AOZ74604.1 acetyltransferase [Clostridium pasteurianum DSM 525 = ATCC 6013]AOZ78401.1 acetyltransferase [Clostridium pasteurianum]ELP57543.1 GCN5-related N-acetyltransferase [Clostridium pasteurianum DSM 525 = ATCC 6013]
MHTRKMVKGDINKVIDIINRNYDEVMIGVHSKDVLDRFKKHNTFEDWEKQMKWKQIFVVEDNGKVIATGALANFGDNTYPKYYISNFFVKPENQNKGVGEILFKYILKLVRDSKVKFLHVPSSRNGIEFYKKMGFIEDSIQNDKLDEITWMTMNIS